MQTRSAKRFGKDVLDRGRNTIGEGRRKMGWQVSEAIARAVKEAVDSGAAQSQNALVQEALLNHLKQLRRQELYAAYERAAADPAFMEEMRATEDAFASSVADGLGTGA